MATEWTKGPQGPKSGSRLRPGGMSWGEALGLGRGGCQTAGLESGLVRACRVADGAGEGSREAGRTALGWPEPVGTREAAGMGPSGVQVKPSRFRAQAVPPLGWRGAR